MSHSEDDDDQHFAFALDDDERMKAQGVSIKALKKDQVVHLHTRRSVYKMTVREDGSGAVRVVGGLFAHETDAYITGSPLSNGAASIRAGWIGVGWNAEFQFGQLEARKWMHTSVVKKIVINGIVVCPAKIQA